MELVVVTAVIGILAALALPAVQRARAAARRATCMNHVRNLAFALTQFDQFHNRLPASGNFGHDENLKSYPHHTWAVSILPHVDKGNLFGLLDLDLPITDAANGALYQAHVPVYVCPDDISATGGGGDISYAVNGGIGFTVRHANGVRDCPVDRRRVPLDLNGDTVACSGNAADDDRDRERFRYLGLFFLETWNTKITRRHLSLGDVKDGTSQTFLVTENVRAGVNPDDPRSSFGDPNPYRCAVYVGNPCPMGICADGTVDYSLSNSGADRINSGLSSAEGSSPVPNSFHPGGVHMAYADGHVNFLSESIDGSVYAALASPLGIRLEGTSLSQAIVSGDGF